MAVVTGGRSLRACAHGVVYAEFLIAFFPLFLLFLCTAQLALIAQASLAVQHAAVRAARKAVVVLDDDPAQYDGQKRELLTGDSGSAFTDAALAVLSLFSDTDAKSTESPTGAVQGGARLSAIRRAAYIPLAAIAPSPAYFREALASFGGADKHSVGGSVGSQPWLRVLLGYGTYVRASSALVFPRAPGSAALRPAEQKFGRHEPVTTRIVLLFPCTIPIARSIMCRSLQADLGFTKAAKEIVGVANARSLDDVSARFARAREAAARASAAAQQLLGELEQAEFPGLALGWAASTNERFVVLRAEDTLPNQGAPYKYASQLDDDEDEEDEDAGAEP